MSVVIMAVNVWMCPVMTRAVQCWKHSVAGSSRAETLAAQHSAVDGELQRQNAASGAEICGPESRGMMRLRTVLQK